MGKRGERRFEEEGGGGGERRWRKREEEVYNYHGREGEDKIVDGQSHSVPLHYIHCSSLCCIVHFRKIKV